MTAELVVFDVAGTTVLDGDAVLDAIAEALAAAGVASDRHEIRRRMGLPKPVAIQELIGLQWEATTEELQLFAAQIHEDFLQLARQRYENHPDVRGADGALEVFEALHDRSIKVALDTGFSRATLDVVLRRLNWLNDAPIDCTVASDEVDCGRPAPNLIRRAMHLAGVSDPLRVVKVGDTPVDIESGRAAHCGLVVGVSYGTHSREELLPYGPGAIIDRLADLLHLLDDPARL